MARSHFEALGVIVPVEGCVTPPLESDSEKKKKKGQGHAKNDEGFLHNKTPCFLI